MTTRELAKEYTLSDESVWTAVELGKHLGLTATAARYRLNQSSNVKWVMRKHFKVLGRKKAHTCKKFELSDGSSMSVENMAKKYNINLATMYARLSRGIRDVDILSKKPTQGRRYGDEHTGYQKIGDRPKSILKIIQQRNAYDPLSKLFLMMKGV